MEFSSAKREAKREGKTLSQWVREMIRARISRRPKEEAFDPIEEMRKLELPAPPIEQMLEEIERGRW